ncbi:hypothetical protein KQJ25_00640, partial [Escherichia sp. S69_ASV_4]|nr:hypothetical protein [Escherichia sp. S69_ASV_4]
LSSAASDVYKRQFVQRTHISNLITCRSPTSSPFNYQYLTGTTLREPLEQHGTYPSSWLTLARY